MQLICVHLRLSAVPIIAMPSAVMKTINGLYIIIKKIIGWVKKHKI